MKEPKASVFCLWVGVSPVVFFFSIFACFCFVCCCLCQPVFLCAGVFVCFCSCGLVFLCADVIAGWCVSVLVFLSGWVSQLVFLRASVFACWRCGKAMQYRMSRKASDIYQSRGIKGPAQRKVTQSDL